MNRPCQVCQGFLDLLLGVYDCVWLNSKFRLRNAFMSENLTAIFFFSYVPDTKLCQYFGRCARRGYCSSRHQARKFLSPNGSVRMVRGMHARMLRSYPCVSSVYHRPQRGDLNGSRCDLYPTVTIACGAHH